MLSRCAKPVSVLHFSHVVHLKLHVSQFRYCFLCSALLTSAGYDVVVIESVGLGQSEVDIDRAVDMLLLLVPPGNIHSRD